LSELDYWISFLASYHVTSNFANVDITGLSKGHISLLLEVSHMVGYAGSPICIVHADMTLIRPKVKVTRQWLSAPSEAFIIVSSIHLIFYDITHKHYIGKEVAIYENIGVRYFQQEFLCMNTV